MSGFTITITDVGRAALINAQNTGTNAFWLSQVGVSTQHITGNLAALTVLPNERKRLATMAGDVVADDTLHVTIRDETNDAYPMRAFGLYTSTGILFAVYSQTASIIEKSAAAMLLLAVDAKLVALSTDQVEFGPVGFTLPPASETVAGITEVATDSETDAGTDNWRYITPRLLKRALAALSGFALLGHKHDAADTTSGVFNVGRIPALGMEKITGLANALAGKATELHTHAIAQITGLVDELAGKASAIHQHHADDISQGVLAVGRIPALAMEKITGLAAALAAKASINSPDFTGNVRLPPAVVVKRKSNLIGGQINLEKPTDETTLIGDIRIDVLGDKLRFFQDAAPWTGVHINLADSGSLNSTHLWSSSNFNPSSGGLFTATPDLVAGNNANNIGLKEFETRRAISTTANSPMGQWSQIIGIPHDVDNTAQLALGIQADRAFFRRRSVGSWQPWFELATTAAVVPANAAQYRANSGSQLMAPSTVWSAAEIQTITQAVTLAVNLGTGLNFTTTMTGNRTLGAPSNAKPGQSGVIQIFQDGTGGKTLAFNAAWKFPNGIVPVLSTAANARDVLVFTVITSGDVVASLMKDVRR